MKPPCGGKRLRLCFPKAISKRTLRRDSRFHYLYGYDLEPYYTQAEHLYQVHGLRGADPTDPPASAPYLFPPLSHEPRIQELYDNLEKAGYHPSPAPTGILLNEQDRHHSSCIRCDTCDGFPCLMHAKADAEVIGVRPALTDPNVTLVTHAHALRLTTSASGREVTEVVVDCNGISETYRGNIVVVSAGPANSAFKVSHWFDQ